LSVPVQVIASSDCPQNGQHCVEWSVELYSLALSIYDWWCGW